MLGGDVRFRGPKSRSRELGLGEKWRAKPSAADRVLARCRTEKDTPASSIPLLPGFPIFGGLRTDADRSAHLSLGRGGMTLRCGTVQAVTTPSLVEAVAGV